MTLECSCTTSTPSRLHSSSGRCHSHSITWTASLAGGSAFAIFPLLTQLQIIPGISHKSPDIISSACCHTAAILGGEDGQAMIWAVVGPVFCFEDDWVYDSG